MPSQPLLDRHIGFINPDEPRLVWHGEHSVDTVRNVPVHVSDVLALHDAGVHLFFNSAAKRRFLYTYKAANSHLDPFTKIPRVTDFKLCPKDRFYLGGVEGMPGRLDCEGLVKTAGIACVYGMLLFPQQGAQFMGLCLPYGNADANIERCAAMVRLYCDGEAGSLQNFGISLVSLAHAVSPEDVSTESLMKGVAASVASFAEKISQLTKHLPRHFEDGSIALSA